MKGWQTVKDAVILVLLAGFLGYTFGYDRGEVHATPHVYVKSELRLKSPNELWELANKPDTTNATVGLIVEVMEERLRSEHEGAGLGINQLN